MMNFKYIGERVAYQIEFKRISDNIVSIKGKLPVKTKGFTLSRENKNDKWDYSDYTIIHNQLENEIQFSNK